MLEGLNGWGGVSVCVCVCVCGGGGGVGGVRDGLRRFREVVKIFY